MARTTDYTVTVTSKEGFIRATFREYSMTQGDLEGNELVINGPINGVDMMDITLDEFTDSGGEPFIFPLMENALNLYLSENNVGEG